VALVRVRGGGCRASYGPLIDMSIDGAGIGSDVSAPTGEASLSLKVQAPRWMQVDRIEIYENARLIRELEGEEIHGDEVVKFEGDLIIRPRDAEGTPVDAWYVAVAIGDQDLAPLFTPVEIPNIEFSDVVLGAVSSFDLGSFDIEGFVGAGPGHPRTFPILPYAVTNPIWRRRK